jgi:prepilin-type N-terminal cleavage/methylation domain-containing protein/prepilin-type processing-associated H-X9-DG protein
MNILPLHTSRRASGFTLIELLTVIAIIGVLSGLSIVAIGRARESARTGACIAHWREYGHALGLFVADNKGRMPFTAYSYKDDNGQTKNAGYSQQAWYELALYARSDAYSMAGQKLEPLKALMREDLGCTEENWDPGFNVFVSDVPMVTISKPSSTVFGTDVRSRSADGSSWQIWIDLNQLGADSNKQLGNAEEKPHHGRVNMLYVDGHVASRRLSEVMIADFTRDSSNWRAAHETTPVGPARLDQ